MTDPERLIFKLLTRTHAKVAKHLEDSVEDGTNALAGAAATRQVMREVKRELSDGITAYVQATHERDRRLGRII